MTSEEAQVAALRAARLSREVAAHACAVADALFLSIRPAPELAIAMALAVEVLDLLRSLAPDEVPA